MATPQAGGSSASGAAASAAAASNAPAQEFTVRLQRENKLKFMIMKFGNSVKVDFTKCPQVQVERENNFTEFKLSHGVDTMPKFGAGSEYGREQRDIARRKKYGIHRKTYDPDQQPWLMKVGTGKQAKKYKGVKEGGVLDNASYYIFTQCPDGAFEAHPVVDWYNFTPQIKYKSLSHEEAEDEFLRRDKTLNYFSIMLKKRLTGDKDENIDDEEGGQGKNKKKKKSKSKDLLLTDQDEWMMLSDDDDDEDSDNAGSGSDEDKPKKKKGEGKGTKEPQKKRNSDSEASEESDDLDEGKEVDYMTDTDSEDEDMYADPAKMNEGKYGEKGVEDEEALRDEEEDEEEEKKEEDEEDKDMTEEQKAEKKRKKEKKEGDSDSDSSSGSDSDSDPEKEGNLSSAIFMQKKPDKKSSKHSSDGSANNSRSGTPTNSQDSDKKGKKRKQGDVTDGPSSSKKTRPGTPTVTDISKASQVISDQSAAGTPSEGITEDAIRRYLMRKPMTTKELLQRFRSKHPNMTKEQLFNTMVMLLKKIGPETKMIGDKKYLTLKKT